jgi:hypothetical protein
MRRSNSREQEKKSLRNKFQRKLQVMEAEAQKAKTKRNSNFYFIKAPNSGALLEFGFIKSVIELCLVRELHH